MRKLLLMLATVLFFTGHLLAQTRTVTGKVTDDSGEAIPGATIQIKGTTTGTVTDGTGHFSISVSPDAKFLVISLIGMTSKEVAIGSGSTYAVTLSPSSSAIDEVVIVGYGSGRRAGTVVGSVTQVSGAKVQDRPTANAFDALQGKVAGLQIFTSSGEPSQTSSLRIRGVGSLGASSTPLIILDGSPIDANTILTLNPEDFETVAVLKDASATSIYGARAANGVIQITTKKGKIGQDAVVSLKTQYGVSNLMSTDYFENFMNSKELTDFWVATGQRTRGSADTLLKNFPNDTKWYNEYYKSDVPTYQGDISVSGGGGKTSYYVSGGYFHQDGLAYRSAYDRYTMRSNVHTTANNWLKVGANLSGGYDKRQLNPYGTNSTNRGLALLAPPFYSPRDANGVEYPDLIPGWGRYNPKYLAEKIRANNNNVQLNLSGYVEVTPIQNLLIKSQAGLEFSEYRTSGTQMPSYIVSPNNGNASEFFSRAATRTITNTAEYKFSINDVHRVTAMVGQEYIDYVYSDFSGSSTGQTDDRLIMISNGPAGRSVGSSQTEYAYLSYFGRLEYGYNDKYFVDVSLRQDESSRFGRNNRTAQFWSVGAMWKASREDFLRDVSWLKDLTVRASYGTSGNSAIGNYLSLALVGTNTYDNSTGWGINAPGNPNLSWESQKMTTFGVAFRLFDKVDVEAEFYNKKTGNMLVSVPYPFTSGFANITDNVGSLKNTGVELTVGADIYRSKTAYITPRLNFFYNKNEVTELFQGNKYWIIPNTGVSWAIGQPVSFVYPIFAQVNKDTGLPEWYLPDPANITNTRKDPKNVTSTFTPDLQQSTGIKREAPFNGGFGLGAGYKGLYLDVDFSFSKGKYLINNDRYFFENPNQFAGFNQSKVILDYWKQAGDVARFPRYGVQFTQFDSRLIEDASFLRMKNITLGYNFQSQLLRRTKFFKAATLYVTGRNLLTFTKYTGPDPEVDSNLTLGVNPNTKQTAIGLNLQF